MAEPTAAEGKKTLGPEDLARQPSAPSVFLATSRIPQTGLGVFAATPFSSGSPVTFFDGQIINYDEAKKRMANARDSHIRTLQTMHWAIDALYRPDGTLIQDPIADCAGMGLGGYINDARGSEYRHNVIFHFVDAMAHGPGEIDPRYRIVLIVAIRDIAPGEELYIDYGVDYWRKVADRRNPNLAKKFNPFVRQRYAM